MGYFNLQKGIGIFTAEPSFALRKAMSHQSPPLTLLVRK